jgi:hypothetical protein
MRFREPSWVAVPSGKARAVRKGPEPDEAAATTQPYLLSLLVLL